MKAIVTTRYGKLEGEEQGGLFVFKGVPFAAPPVGPRRWMPPEEPRTWSGVRLATSFGPCAPQNPVTVGPLAQIAALRSQERYSEDCLFLNIWTPALDRARRPVMVWIHGGAFEVGSGAQPRCEGAPLARRGDVVSVSINYRLGAFGFLRLADLTNGRIPATGNEALLDQVRALEWIRDNIEEFGGDPGNVTVFGESAGGMSIGTLMGMPAARGLFHRAVLQSGACHTTVPPERASRVAEWLARKLGQAGIDADALRAAPVEAILKSTLGGAAAAPELELSGAMFEPVVDGSVVPRPPIESVRMGQSGQVAVMAGTTLEETRLFLARDPRNRILDEAGLAARVRRAVGSPTAETMITAYRAARGARGETTSAPELCMAIGTDRMFRVPAIRLLEAHGGHDNPVYNYLFTWHSPFQGGSLGACHALEISFVFGTIGHPGLDLFVGSGPAAERLSGNMQDAWIAFARTGSPACAALGEWPAYTPAQRATMLLGEKCELATATMEAERETWDGIADDRIGENI